MTCFFHYLHSIITFYSSDRLMDLLKKILLCTELRKSYLNTIFCFDAQCHSQQLWSCLDGQFT